MDGKIVVLPNGTLANNSITNYSAAIKRRIDISVGISLTVHGYYYSKLLVFTAWFFYIPTLVLLSMSSIDFNKLKGEIYS